jgi:hypothetical protein
MAAPGLTMRRSADMNTSLSFPSPARRPWQVPVAAWWLAPLVLLGACGGGAYIDDTGPPPDISLAASTPYAQRGQPVQLVAAVNASNGVDYVNFYRIDFGSPVLLGTVYQPPAKWATAVPINAGNWVDYFARVCDQAGYCTNSTVESVAVGP